MFGITYFINEIFIQLLRKKYNSCVVVHLKVYLVWKSLHKLHSTSPIIKQKDKYSITISKNHRKFKENIVQIY
jgi:hypothetical protein